MGSFKKLTHSEVNNSLRHNCRKTRDPSNKDIDSKRSHLNYSFDMNHGKLSEYQYYKNRSKELYLYGRGSNREKESISAFGIVITCPKEIIGDRDKEYRFFKGTFDFVSARYGPENILNNTVHYDEAGDGPHFHILDIPATKINHDRIHFKTVKTKEAIRLESGRYEYKYRFRLDKHGKRIPLNNYSRMSDYYDEKISANDVLNKVELRNFHQDLQMYLDDNDIEGRVLTGTTGGMNFSVKELKEFTAKTGLKLENVKEIIADRSVLECIVQQNELINDLTKELNETKTLLEALREELITKESTLDKSHNNEWDRSSGWGDISRDSEWTQKENVVEDERRF